MIELNARFDGKVLIPEHPLDLVADQLVRIHVEPIEDKSKIATDFRSWIGLGLPLPENHTPRFSSNDDLWEKDR